MSGTDEELDQLDDLLNGIPVERDGMTLSELDGYVAALIVCPEMIPASEWMSVVWGGDGAFADIEQAEEFIDAVVGHYNRVAGELAEDPETYAPVLEIDPNSDEVLWESWVNGFERAMRLRADAWEAVVQSDDEDAAASVNLILAMNESDQCRSELTEKAIDELDRMAPSLIPDCVRKLNVWTKSRGFEGRGAGDSVHGAPFGTDDPPAYGRKVGRNEPCPCGSGRKYKRCCGAN